MQTGLISIIIPIYKQEKELEQALLSIKNQTYKDLEIIIERDEKHEGAPVMRNRGLKKAQGEYIIFWDADVVAVPEMLEKMKQVLDENSVASFVYSDYYMIKKLMKAQKFDLKKLQNNNYIHSTSLIRRKDVISWDENLKRFQDWDLWLTLAEQGKTGIYISEALFTIVAQGSISSWLPSFAYQKPWKYLPGFKKKVRKYEKAREVIRKKHRL